MAYFPIPVKGVTAFFKRECLLIQMAKGQHEKMLSVANYWRNVNQNDNEISPHIHQDDHH